MHVRVGWVCTKVLNYFKDLIVLYTGLFFNLKIINTWQVRLQSYTDLAPVCIIRYTLTDRVLNILR
jgi:hypothetical protein